MQENNKNLIEEILNYLGYTNINSTEHGSSEKDKSYCHIDINDGADSNCYKDSNLDLENALQDVDPILFVTVGELIGNVIASELPFNAANAIANYLNLIGQIIETYSAQQSYFQSGQERFHKPEYSNACNSFETCKSDKTSNSNM